MEGVMPADHVLSSPAGIQPAVIRPAFPSTPAEFITVLAHFHRAEIARMAGWRDRIDRTSNWAITVVAAMLSVSLSTPTAHHGVLVFGMLLVFLLLVIESRRYQFFDVFRFRVRTLERSYYAQILAPEPEPDGAWAHILGEDLRRPLFRISHGQALSRRLRRNYGWMFLILLLAWLVKITSTKLQPSAAAVEFVPSLAEWLQNAAVGPVPGWVVITAVGAFYVWILYVAFRRLGPVGELAHGNVHV
jgi:uncharacterized membrane protein